MSSYIHISERTRCKITYTGERGNMSVRPRILMFSERAG